MATRLYFVDSNANMAGVSIAPDAAWDQTNEAVTRMLHTAATGAASVTSIIVTKAVVGPINVLAAQFVLPGLAAQTIAGELKGQFRLSCSNSTLDAHPQVVARVVEPVAGTVRGTLLSAINPGGVSNTPGADDYEVATTATNRKVPSGWSGAGKALASVGAEDGDWLIVECGFRFYDVAATSRSMTLSVSRGYTYTDLPEDESTTTSSLNGWLEFSQTLSLSMRATPALPIRHTPVRFPEIQIPIPTTGQTWPRGAGSW